MNARSCEKELLSTAEVARMVGRTITTVNRWAVNGRIPVAARANGRVFRREDVVRLVAELEAEAEAQVAALREQLEAAEQRADRLRAAARPLEGIR